VANKRTMLALFLLLVTVVLAACGSPQAGGLRVEDVWARPAMAGGDALVTHGEGTMGQGMAAPGTGAVFMRLVNHAPEADRLLGAQTEVAGVVEIHETVLDGEVMRMQMLPAGLEIPAGGEVLLKPGSYHVMLIGVQRDLEPGERFSLELQFEKAGTLAVEVEVRQP
jgi:periplasmic copper chaperone A